MPDRRKTGASFCSSRIQKSKYYLADPAISGSVLLLGKHLLQRPEKLGSAVEAAFFKHLFTRYHQQSIGFSYWLSQS